MLENDNLEKHFMEIGKMKFMHCFEVIFSDRILQFRNINILSKH